MNYAPIEVKPSDALFRDFRVRARFTLALPGLRLRVIIATLVFLSMWVGGFYMVENVWYALDWGGLYETSESLYTLTDAIFYMTDALFCVFAGLPLVYGYARYMVRCATGVVPPLSTLFDAFSSRASYFRALALTLRLFLRLALWLGVVGLLVLVAEALRGMTGDWIVFVLAPLAGIYAVFGWIGIGIGDAVFALELMHPELSVRELLRLSRRMLQPQLLRLWLLKITLLPQWLLGALSLGTLLIFHALPFCLFTEQYAVWDIIEQKPTASGLLADNKQE